MEQLETAVQNLMNFFSSYSRDGPVEPGQDAKVRMDLMPQLSGLRKLVVNFESDRLKGVKGFKNIIIAPPPK